MEKQRTYTDYANKTALTLPDDFIDVKTGNSIKVSQKILEQVDYHSNNNSLIHLVLSALNSYLHPKNMNSEIILAEINEIKKMMQSGYVPDQTPAYKEMAFQGSKQDEVDLKEVEDVLEAFGG